MVANFGLGAKNFLASITVLVIWTQGTSLPTKKPTTGRVEEVEYEAQPRWGISSNLVDKQPDKWSLEIEIY